MPQVRHDGVVEELCRTHEEVMKVVRESGDVSLLLRAESEYKKALVLAAASYFEASLTQAVVSMFEERTNDNGMLVAFVRSKAVERRYHDWFDWSARNGNHFFRAFGEGFKKFMEAKVKNEDGGAEAVRAFLRLGQLRNELVHGNYAVFSVQLTVEEILQLYQDASVFVDYFDGNTREFMSATGGPVVV